MAGDRRTARSTVYQFNKFYDWVFLDHGNFWIMKRPCISWKVFSKNHQGHHQPVASLSAQGVVWNELAAPESYLSGWPASLAWIPDAFLYTQMVWHYAATSSTAQALKLISNWLFTTPWAGRKTNRSKKSGEISAIDKKLSVFPETGKLSGIQQTIRKLSLDPAGTPKKLNKDHLVVTCPAKAGLKKLKISFSWWTAQQTPGGGKKPCGNSGKKAVPFFQTIVNYATSSIHGRFSDRCCIIKFAPPSWKSPFLIPKPPDFPKGMENWKTSRISSNFASLTFEFDPLTADYWNRTL